jgi:DNA mismatch endonuclease (patch repair protein)
MKVSKRRLQIWNTPRNKLKRGKLEYVIEDWLKKLSIKYEIQYPLSGIPDFFIKPNICVFVDECYWHRCPLCFPGKRGRNIDKEVNKKLLSQGFIVLRFWEHEINYDIKSCIKKICEAVNNEKNIISDT